jgi:hypothetical protein
MSDPATGAAPPGVMRWGTGGHLWALGSRGWRRRGHYRPEGCRGQRGNRGASPRDARAWGAHRSRGPELSSTLLALPPAVPSLAPLVLGALGPGLRPSSMTGDRAPRHHGLDVSAGPGHPGPLQPCFHDQVVDTLYRATATRRAPGLQPSIVPHGTPFLQRGHPLLPRGHCLACPAPLGHTRIDGRLHLPPRGLGGWQAPCLDRGQERCTQVVPTGRKRQGDRGHGRLLSWGESFPLYDIIGALCQPPSQHCDAHPVCWARTTRAAMGA